MPITAWLAFIVAMVIFFGFVALVIWDLDRLWSGKRKPRR